MLAGLAGADHGGRDSHAFGFDRATAWKEMESVFTTLRSRQMPDGEFGLWGRSRDGGIEFLTPYAFWGKGFAPGVEIHATATENLMRGDWRSQIKPQSVMGSVLAWTAMGLPVVLAGNHDEAGQCCSRLLFIAARRRWRESLALAESVLSIREDAAE